MVNSQGYIFIDMVVVRFRKQPTLTPISPSYPKHKQLLDFLKQGLVFTV